VALAFCLAAKVSANAANDAMQQLKPAEDTSNAPEGFPPAPPPRSGDEDAPQSAEASAGRVCADYSGYGFYPGPSTPMKSVLSKGNPSGLQFLPPTISYCEYEQLTIDCVDRINMYRSGELKFSNGQADPGRATRALAADTGNMRCSANQAMGDLFQNVRGDGGCDGAHYHRWVVLSVVSVRAVDLFSDRTTKIAREPPSSVLSTTASVMASLRAS